MPRYKLVVMTHAMEGREEEYNEWYQNVHLHDVVALEGFKSAQRFRLNRSLLADGSAPQPYLAIYDVETDDIDRAIDGMLARAADGRMVISTALADDKFAVVYEEFGPAVER